MKKIKVVFYDTHPKEIDIPRGYKYGFATQNREAILLAYHKTKPLLFFNERKLVWEKVQLN